MRHVDLLDIGLSESSGRLFEGGEERYLRRYMSDYVEGVRIPNDDDWGWKTTDGKGKRRLARHLAWSRRGTREQPFQ
jgi:hypothetical protein